MEQPSSAGVREAANGKWPSKLSSAIKILLDRQKLMLVQSLSLEPYQATFAISMPIWLALENCNCSLLAAYLGLNRLVQLHFFVSGDEEHCCQE